MAFIGKVHDAKTDGQRKRRRLRYVQTLPTLCTLGNLLCGFGAIVLCLRALSLADASVPLEVIQRNSQLVERLLPTHIVMAAYLLFASMIFDALDGRIARLTRSTSDFGAQLDSLADVVSFGAAPAIIVVALMTRQVQDAQALADAPQIQSLLTRGAWLMAAVYLSCAALRLARFNVETGADEASHMSFRGLPSPGAAACIACLVILHDHVYLYDKAGGAKTLAEQGGMLSEAILWSLPVLAVLFGLLMVSRVEYVHVVNRYLRGRLSFAGVVRGLIVVALTVIYPEVTIPVLVVGYALSGPLIVAYGTLFGGRGHVEEEEDVEVDTDITDEPQDLAG